MISGPSGAGYTHTELWSTANLTAFANVSDGCLQRTGLRVITVWDNVNSGIAQAYATNCPTLLGLTGQNSYSGVFKTTTPGSSSSLFYQNTGLLGAEQPNIVTDWAFCLNGSQLGAGLGAGTGGSGSDFSLYGGNVTDGNPHIAMYARAGDTISLYVDGVMVATQNALCTAARGNYPFQIGAMTTSSYFFNGDIAEIQIYNRALNAWEIMSANETLAVTYGVGGAAGEVVVWGNNANGQTNAPKSLPST